MICAFRIFCLAFCNVDFAFLARVRKKNITRCTRMRRPRLHSVFCTLNVGGMECRMQNRVHKMHRRMEWFGMQTQCATGHVWKSLGNAGGRSKSHVFCPLFKGSLGTITDHKRISRDLASTVNFKRKCRRFSYDLFGTSHQFFQKCTKKSVFRVFLNRTRHTQYIAIYWIR